MARLAAIVFDLHGTLVRQTRDARSHMACAYAAWTVRDLPTGFDEFCSAWRRVEGEYHQRGSKGASLLAEGRRDEAEEALREYSLHHHVRRVGEILNAICTDSQVDETVEGFQKSWMNGLEIPDWTIPLLDRLSAQGSLGLVTNFRDGPRLREWLGQNGLGRAFGSCVVISEEIGLRKPHPKLLEAALQRLHVADVSQCLFVGDDPIEDVMCGRIAGIRTILVGQQAGAGSVEIVESVDRIESVLDLG